MTEGDVSEVSTLVRADALFVRSCARLISQVADALRRSIPHALNRGCRAVLLPWPGVVRLTQERAPSRFLRNRWFIVQTMEGKVPRERIDTGSDKRYVRRDKGQFKESDDVGRSSALSITLIAFATRGLVAGMLALIGCG